MAELLGTLRKTGLDKNTIVVFTSDHGDMIGSHGQQRPWEESARVPMLFRFPETLGIQPRRVEGATNSEDVMPALLTRCDRPSNTMTFFPGRDTSRNGAEKPMREEPSTTKNEPRKEDGNH